MFVALPDGGLTVNSLTVRSVMRCMPAVYILILTDDVFFLKNMNISEHVADYVWCWPRITEVLFLPP